MSLRGSETTEVIQKYLWSATSFYRTPRNAMSLRKISFDISFLHSKNQAEERMGTIIYFIQHVDISIDCYENVTN